MVLAELSSQITNALRKMRNATIIDDSVVDEMLKAIGNALVTADVNFKTVGALQQNIKKSINLEEIPAGIDKRKAIKKVVFDELVKMLDPGVTAWKPQKGKTNVIMFVGLQGSGKTTTVTKLAAYYKRKGWRPALLCCDTFRAGAYDQLAQNATRAKIPFYGSYTERDPVKLAHDGLKKFKEVGNDIVIVDTSGRHKQEAALFEEMEQVANVVKPNQIIFVMDGSIGQAALDQALAFKNKVDIGAVILTKLDGHARGGGALSAVAATKSPIIFIGTGEDINDLQEFEVQSFVSRLLGMGDVKGMIDIIKEVVPKESQPKIAKRLQEGKFSLRDMYEQFQNMLKMGPLDQVIGMLPMETGLNQLLKGAKGEAGHLKIKSYMTIMDSMTDEELDIPKVLTPPRIARIARGSGRSIKEVNELIVQYKQFEKVVVRMKNVRPGRMNNLQNLVPPHLLKQMGGASGLNSIIRQMGKDGLK
jgi:signal recognition particle subunit SRP54